MLLLSKAFFVKELSNITYCHENNKVNSVKKLSENFLRMTHVSMTPRGGNGERGFSHVGKMHIKMFGMPSFSIPQPVLCNGGVFRVGTNFILSHEVLLLYNKFI